PRLRCGPRLSPACLTAHPAATLRDVRGAVTWDADPSATSARRRSASARGTRTHTHRPRARAGVLRSCAPDPRLAHRPGQHAHRLPPQLAVRGHHRSRVGVEPANVEGLAPPVKVCAVSSTPAARPLTAPSTTSLDRALSLITTTPDFPSPGILFRDVTPLLTDPDAYASTLAAAALPFCDSAGLPQFDLVAGIEARGFIVSAGIAALTGTGTLPIRKEGKLPDPQVHVAYGLEYAEAAIE